MITDPQLTAVWLRRQAHWLQANVNLLHHHSSIRIEYINRTVRRVCDVDIRPQCQNGIDVRTHEELKAGLARVSRRRRNQSLIELKVCLERSALRRLAPTG